MGIFDSFKGVFGHLFVWFSFLFFAVMPLRLAEASDAGGDGDKDKDKDKDKDGDDDDEEDEGGDDDDKKDWKAEALKQKKAADKAKKKLK